MGFSVRVIKKGPLDSGSKGSKETSKGSGLIQPRLEKAFLFFRLAGGLFDTRKWASRRGDKKLSHGVCVRGTSGDS